LSGSFGKPVSTFPDHALGGEKLLDLRKRKRREFLGDFGGDTLDDLGVKRPAESAKYFRRRDDDELLETVGVRVAIERFGKLVGKPLLCKTVPVDFFHTASGDTKARKGTSRAIRALLARWRIVLLENPLNDKIDALGVASVAQEESLLAVTDKNETVVWNARSKSSVHFGYPREIPSK
jgi:hypothetical protein